MMTNKQVIAELEGLVEAGGGVLQANSIIEFAKDPNTALHSKFEWDDTVAGHQYRLEQARRLIRVTVIEYNGTGPTRLLLNLKDDRYTKGGGYRRTIDIMTDDEKRASLLQEALHDAKRWRARYNGLKELASVFSELDKIETLHKTKTGV